MAPRGPPFDFDLNELPPPENDGENGMSAGLVPEPSAPKDPLLAVPVPEPTAQQDPLLAAPVPEPTAQQDPLPPPAPVPEPTTANVPLPARARSASLSPVPEASPVDPPPAPLRAPVPVPVPSPHHHLPSPVLDLEAPLSPLDDDEEEDEADLPLPPPPPLPLPPPPPMPPSWYRVDSSDAPTVYSGRQGDAAPARHYSSPETWAPGGSRAATASDTTYSHMSRRRPYSCDDAISKQRRIDDYDEVGGSSSRSRGRRRSEFGSPPLSERSGLAPPRHYYEQDGGWRAPAADGRPGAPAKNRRRRRRAQRPQYGGPVQKQQGRGRERKQGFRGQERPQVQNGPHRGPEVPKVGYASYNPPASESFVRRDSSSGARLSPEQERISGWDRRPSPPFRPSSSSGPHGKEDPHPGRQSQAQEPPKIGGYQHRDREAPSFKQSSTGGRDDGSFGGRHISPEEKTVTGGAHRHQQTKAPRGRDEQFPDQAYHPNARRRSGFDVRPDDDGGGRNPARPEPWDSWEQRSYSKQLSSGGPARDLRYYGDVQE